jgi:two-component system, cell cycle response regulator DivK
MEREYNWKGKNILIVEDDNTSFIYVSETLKIFNPAITRCQSGLAAFFQCMAHPAPDLVIMDIKLPELSGYDATKLIKKFQPHIPIVALTACAMTDERQKGLKAGCDYYTTKPILPTELIDIVDIYLGHPQMEQCQPMESSAS